MDRASRVSLGPATIQERDDSSNLFVRRRATSMAFTRTIVSGMIVSNFKLGILKARLNLPFTPTLSLSRPQESQY